MAPMTVDKAVAGRRNKRAFANGWDAVDTVEPSLSAPVDDQEPEAVADGNHSPPRDSLLAIFDLLPDILAMAADEERDSTDNLTEICDRLVEAYRIERAPFKWATSTGTTVVCSRCRAREAALRWDLENPSVLQDSPLRSARLDSDLIHDVRQHGAGFPPQVAAFLERVRMTWAGR